MKVLAILTAAIGLAAAMPSSVNACTLVTNWFAADECAGLCVPGSSCQATSVRPYLFGLSTQPASCGCVPGASLAPTPLPAPVLTATAVATVIAAVQALGVAIGIGIAVLLTLMYLLYKQLCPPRVLSFTAKVRRPQVSEQTRDGLGRQCWLSLGKNINTQAGIEFTAIVQAHQGCTGRLEFVQDLVTDMMVVPGRNPANPKECIHTPRVLDTEDPYHSQRVDTGGVHVFKTSDSPGMCLSSPHPVELASDVNDFRMFLMWRSDAYNGAFRIPLGVIHWTYTGNAQASDQRNRHCSHRSASGNTLHWKLVKPYSATASNGTWTVRWPVTSPNWLDFPWTPC
jgi:hypothetical protein